MKQEKNQNGIVALATTIIVGLLLVIIALSTILLMVGEQRQATDADQSVRAYYAAEGAIEDRLLLIKRALDNGIALPTNTVCSPATGPYNTAVTCVTVKRDQTQLIGRLAREKAYQVDATGRTFNSMKISWNLASDSINPRPAQSGFPRGADWTYPAVMDMNIIYYPVTNPLIPDFSANSTDFNFKNLVLKPAAPTESAFSSIDFTTVANGGPVPVLCQASAVGYYCTLEITGFNTGSRNFIVRFRPRYNGTSYKMEFFANPQNLNCTDPVGSNFRCSMPDQMVTIDATAKAGDVYRRVVSKLEVSAGLLTGLDYVLFSDTDICKDFVINRSDGIVSLGVCPY